MAKSKINEAQYPLYIQVQTGGKQWFGEAKKMLLQPRPN